MESDDIEIEETSAFNNSAENHETRVSIIIDECGDSQDETYEIKDVKAKKNNKQSKFNCGNCTNIFKKKSNRKLRRNEGRTL